MNKKLTSDKYPIVSHGDRHVSSVLFRQTTRHGFTLLELMVAISLMVLLVGIVAMVFSQSSTICREGTERMIIYNTALVSCDSLTRDLSSCLSLDNDMQLFSLDEDTPPEDGGDNENAKDWISFHATVPIKGEVKGAAVIYRLYPDNDPMVLGGTQKTVVTKRSLYVLRREVRDFNGKLLGSSDMCHYVLSFNIEYYDRTTGRYRQISEHSLPPDNFEWPIGDNKPDGETLHSAIRITLRVVASATERQERVFPRVIWLPMGG